MSRNLQLSSMGLSVLLLLCLASATRADPIVTSISGNTTGAHTFNRPGALIENDQDPAPFTPTVLSGFVVPYNVVSFTVSVGGSYGFSHLSSFNNYLLLYENSFDPASPLTNALLAR